MAELTDTYVVHGACSTCSKGMRASQVVLQKTHGVFLRGQAQMTVKDCKGEDNVICFGGCYSMENPSTAAEAEKIQKAVEEACPDTFLDKVMGFFTGGKKEKKQEAPAEEGVPQVVGVCTPHIIAQEWDHGQDGVETGGKRPMMGGAKLYCIYGGEIEIVESGQPEAGSGVVSNKDSNNSEAQDGSGESFSQMMKSSYGFDEEQAGLIKKAYDCFMGNEENKGLPRKEQIHKLFSNLAGLCINYSGNATRWKLTSGTPPTLEAMEYFENLGMSEIEVFDLMGAINFQHSEGKLLSRASDYESQGFCGNSQCERTCGFKYHITDSKYWNFNYGEQKRDFAHELIQYASFSNDDTLFRKTANAFEPIIGNLNYLSSFKGDVYSGRIEKSDMASDVNAINVYERFLKHEDKDMFEIMENYNSGVESGTINSAEEFLMNMGDGDAEKGYEELKKEINDVDYGSQYITSGAKSIIQDALFTDAIVRGGPYPGDETMEKLFDMREKNKIEDSSKINDEKEKFLNYIYEGWKDEKK